MDSAKKKQLYLIGGIAAAVLVVLAVVLLLTLGGGSKGYDKHYDAAEQAFLHRDYDTALRELDKAMDEQVTEEAYLLMADVYYAQGDTEMAIQVLYLGASRVGGDAIDRMLEKLKAGEDLPEPGDAVSVGGESFAADATSAALNGKGLSSSDLAALSTLTELESLSLSANGLTDVSALTGLAKLTVLDLSENLIRDVSALGALTSLRTLYLDGNPIQEFSPLERLTNLRTLSLKDISITESQLEALQTALPDCSIHTDTPVEEVKELELSGKKFRSDVEELNLGGLELDDISVLAECTKLKKLDLRDNKITDLSPLVDLQELEWLCLWNNEVSDLSPLMSLKKLTYLDVDTNKITDITVLGYLTEMEELWLNNNALRSVEVLKSLTKLTRLGLKNTGLTDKQLDALAGLTELKELTVEENPELSANRVAALKESLPRCTIASSDLLWTVTLGGKTYKSDCKEITLAADAGVTSLAGLERFTVLERLVLDGNAVTDLSPLYGLSSLKLVSLKSTGVSEDEIAALRAKLPGCEIVTDKAEEPDPGYDKDAAAMGASAAVDAAGTGSGYAVLWWSDDAVSAGVYHGFAEKAGELGMNLVSESALSADSEDYSAYLALAQAKGADVVVLAVSDEALALIVGQAEDLGYAPSFVQVY